MKKGILLLSANYAPIAILSWKKAVGLVLGRNKAEIIQEYEDKHSALFNAAVIRLTVKSPDHYNLFRKNKFSKKNLFLRDNFECQYCGESCSGKSGTIDHIVPRSCGGKTDYLNCVIACKRCNFKKDNRTPAEANMPLRNQPRLPTLTDLFNSDYIPQEWKVFLNR